ncbi:hypothetical protein HF650_14420 [Kosakonia sp. SMBL-WEM22]|uniref:hypothetical protein n=1 Tax=Kosakonia sp. SMBL-WEM22 TaxID=2725560 RepID=UPI001659275E|nr:hypothetical protein [Kosakonia sp. SMBL-WEM22]QNQ20871.1 hypothetical protein HF650_14420 [Kosakonia sp. SMBL-WEM22]
MRRTTLKLAWFNGFIKLNIRHQKGFLCSTDAGEMEVIKMPIMIYPPTKENSAYLFAEIRRQVIFNAGLI